VHAVELAEELGIGEVIVPLAPGLLSSQGLLSADIRYDFRRTYVATVAKSPMEELAGLIGELRRDGERALEAYRMPAERIEFALAADMRYRGQAYEIRVALPDSVDEDARDTIIESFHQAHERLYGRRHAGGEVQFVNLMLAVIGRVRAVRHPRLPDATEEARPIAHARTWFRGEPFDDCPTYDRDALCAGHRLGGPAIIAGQDSTVLVPPDWIAVCDAFGNLRMTPARTGPDREAA
jgi:N-methylhydantoinase A